MATNSILLRNLSSIGDETPYNAHMGSVIRGCRLYRRSLGKASDAIIEILSPVHTGYATPYRPQSNIHTGLVSYEAIQIIITRYTSERNGLPAKSHWSRSAINKICGRENRLIGVSDGECR